jgi:glucose-1-phosphatase
MRRAWFDASFGLCYCCSPHLLELHKPMIKTVLFDLGNVILPFDVSRLAAKLTVYCRLSTEEIVERLWSDRIANEFETGIMGPEAYFQHVSELCGFVGLSFEKFVPIFNDIFVEDVAVGDLIRGLKKNHRLGLISNTNPIHVPHVMKHYPTLHEFEKHWWSNEEGLRKPDPKLYHRALDHFDVEPGEAVFIDDLPTNIESAKNIGIKALLYQGVEPLKMELSKLGVNY